MATKDITTITGYSGLAAGSHTLGVKATDSTGTKTDSTMVTVSFTKLAAPSNESISGNDYTFGEVDGVTEYDIYAGNTLLGTVNSSSISITGGYRIETDRQEGNLEIWVLGVYNDVYGWHYFNGGDSCNYVTNASQIILGQYFDCDSMTNNVLVTYDGTLVTSSNYTSHRGKILTIIGDWYADNY